jgi:hypothetical protein
LLNLDNIFNYEITRIDKHENVDVIVEFVSVDNKYSELVSKVELKVILSDDKQFTNQVYQELSQNNFSKFKSVGINTRTNKQTYHEATVNLKDIFQSDHIKFEKTSVYRKVFTFDTKNSKDLYLFTSLNFINSSATKQEEKIFSNYAPNVKFQKILENNKVSSKKIFNFDNIKHLVEEITSSKLNVEPNRYITDYIGNFNDCFRNNQYYLNFVANLKQLCLDSEFGHFYGLKYFSKLLENKINSKDFIVENNFIKTQFLSIDLGDMQTFIEIECNKNEKNSISLKINDLVIEEIASIKRESQIIKDKVHTLLDELNDKKKYNNFLDLFTDYFYSAKNISFLTDIINYFIKLGDIFEIEGFDKDNLLFILNDKMMNKNVLFFIDHCVDNLYYHFDNNFSSNENILISRNNYQSKHSDKYHLIIFEENVINKQTFKEIYDTQIFNFTNIIENDKFFFSPNKLTLLNKTLNVFFDEIAQVEMLFLSILSSNYFNFVFRSESQKLLSIFEHYGFNLDLIQEQVNFNNSVTSNNLNIDQQKIFDNSDNNEFYLFLRNFFNMIFYKNSYFDKRLPSQDSPQQIKLQEESIEANIINYLKYRRIFSVSYYDTETKSWNLLRDLNSNKNLLCRFEPYYNDSLNLYYNEKDMNELINNTFILFVPQISEKTQLNSIKIENNQIKPTFKTKNTEKLTPIFKSNTRR